MVREWRERVGKRIVGKRRVWREERKSGVRGKSGASEVRDWGKSEWVGRRESDAREGVWQEWRV